MAVRFRPFTGTSRGFPSADDVGGRRQESDVTELDRTGDPDSAGRHAAPGGDGGAEGHTQVISIAVGTALASGPPHRSQRALLTHWAPASGSGVEACRREWMLRAGGW